MPCNCQYFKYKDGVLVCSVCGKPAHSAKSPQEFTDKTLKDVEFKSKKK